MRNAWFAVCAGLLLLRPFSDADAQGAASPSLPDPAAILARAKAAAGGNAWDQVRTLHLHEQSVAGGFTGVRDEWNDVRTGRYGIRFSRPPKMGADGFDGISVWTQPANAYSSYVLGDEDARQGAVNAAFQACRAFWYPERMNATLAYGGVQKEEGRTYDVVSITPQAGRPFSVWIDQQTGLIDRFVEQMGEDVQVIRLQDYRAVPEGIKLPFTVRIGDGSSAEWDEVDTVQTVEVNGSLAADQFALPPAPAPDYVFQNNATSTTIPFRLAGGKLLIDVRLNGQGPFAAELDSGGNYIVQPALAKRLALKSEGASKSTGGGEGFAVSSRTLIDTVEIGDVRLTSQPFKVLPFYDEEPELALVGLQIFQRFVVSLDFDRRTVTLTRPESFAYHGNGKVVPFHFQDNQPEVKGSIDGIAGVFAIDTGDNSSLLLIAPFVRRYDLVTRYKAVVPYGGHATGGATYGLMTHTGQLELFGADGRPVVEAHDPLTRLSQQQRGFDANRYVSGNVGIGVLSQFNLVFDYTRQQLIFEKNSHYGEKEVYNRTGLRLQPKGGQWVVIGVIPNSPASEAGVKTGDQIVTMNGQTVAQLAGNPLHDLLRQEVGTKLTLAIRSGSDLRTVTLSLRDLL